MDYFEEVRKIRNLIKTTKADVKRYLDDLDWEAEFKEAQDDDEYSIIKLNDFGISKLWDEIRRVNADSPNQELTNYIADTHHLYHTEIFNYQFDRLKQEFMKRKDEDYMPFLRCEECNQFFLTDRKLKDHKCKGTTKCRNCNKDCRTKERLEAHIEASVCIKKYKCEKCNTFAPTNSEQGWYRHLKSKEHKQNCGIEKVKLLFECKECDKPYRFESEYERHLLSPTHKKICSTK